MAHTDTLPLVFVLHATLGMADACVLSFPPFRDCVLGQIESEQLGIVRQQVSPDPSVNSMLFMDLNEAFAASSGLGTAFLFASPMGGLRRASDIFGRTTVRSRSRATRQRLRSE